MHQWLVRRVLFIFALIAVRAVKDMVQMEIAKSVN